MATDVDLTGRWVRHPKTGEWLVQVEPNCGATGQKVRVIQRNGKSKTVHLGLYVLSAAYGELFSVAVGRPSPSVSATEVQDSQPTGCACGSVFGRELETDCWACRE